MNSRLRIIPAITLLAGASAIAVALLSAAPALAQSTVPRSDPYALRRDSLMESGCFAPCMCPIMIRAPLVGRFRLTFLQSDGLFDHYAVEDVKWMVREPSQTLAVTGSGTYRIGGQPTLLHQLTLDLQVGEEPVQRFDSGLVEPPTDFPSIDARISLNGEYCHDTVFAVHARRVREIRVDRSSISWDGAPACDAHDIVRGSVTALRASGGDFRLAVQACVADDVTGASTPFADDPPPGEAYFFLLRDKEGGIAGSYDSGSPAEMVFADEGIDSAPAACP